MYGATLDKGLRMRATGTPVCMGTLGLVSPNFLAGNPISIRIWGLGGLQLSPPSFESPQRAKNTATHLSSNFLAAGLSILTHKKNVKGCVSI